MRPSKESLYLSASLAFYIIILSALYFMLLITINFKLFLANNKKLIIKAYISKAIIKREALNSRDRVIKFI